MIIQIDTREQLKLTFDMENKYLDGVELCKLDAGDYGCRFNDGHIPPIVFERKSIGDLFGTLGGGHSRFKKEIQRAKDNGVQMIIIIEGTMSKVLRGHEHSTIEGISILRTLFTLWVKYGVIPVFCKDRVEMSRYIVEFYVSVGKQYIKEKKKDGR